MAGAKRSEEIRKALTGMLEQGDFDAVSAYYKRETGALRTLISMSYGKKSIAAWRAMDAVGVLGAAMTPDRGRALIQRILWMMREESGTNAWTGPELIAEVVTRNPKPYEDIPPIVITFHDELIMRAGCLRALARIATVRRALCEEFRPVPGLYLDDPDPAVRGYALMAIAALGAAEYAERVGAMKGDPAMFLYYDGRTLSEITVGGMAAQVLDALRSPG